MPTCNYVHICLHICMDIYIFAYILCIYFQTYPLICNIHICLCTYMCTYSLTNIYIKAILELYRAFPFGPCQASCQVNEFLTQASYPCNSVLSFHRAVVECWGMEEWVREAPTLQLFDGRIKTGAFSC